MMAEVDGEGQGAANAMRLAELCAGIDGLRIVGDGSVEIRGIGHDSRSVKPGDLFVCLVGAHVDGHRFAAQAVAGGAAAVVVQADRQSQVSVACPVVVADDTAAALAALSAAFYGHPTRRMRLVGVTGTNGKTTTTRMMGSILRAAGLCAGTIGTLGAEVMDEEIPSEHTTPQADQLQGLLAEMVARGADAVAMEVSSHALAQRRSDGCLFDAAVFTNLTQDHLDYHKTFEEYYRSKRRLFTDYADDAIAAGKAFCASINLDDPYGQRLARESRGRVLTYGRSAAADVSADDVAVDVSHVRFTARTPAGPLAVRLDIGGAFQVYNALAAVGAALGLGLDPRAIEAGLATLAQVPGRFESVPTGRGFAVLVDYAHTPDAVGNVLDAARGLHPSRVLVVFGCGGDRDRTKRPLMARIAAEKADLVVITSDNPRHEDPAAIIADIVAGLDGARTPYHVEPDRRAAIALALAQAADGDIVVIAGKGHETYQIVGDEHLPFDDRQVVRELLSVPGPAADAKGAP